MFPEFSDWTKFYIELWKLLGVFMKNSYNKNLTNNHFKIFLADNIIFKNITLLKKPLFLVLPYLGPSLIQFITKLTKFHIELVKLMDVFKKRVIM